MIQCVACVFCILFFVLKKNLNVRVYGPFPADPIELFFLPSPPKEKRTWTSQ